MSFMDTFPVALSPWSHPMSADRIERPLLQTPGPALAGRAQLPAPTGEWQRRQAPIRYLQRARPTRAAAPRVARNHGRRAMNCSKRWKKAPRRRSGLFNFLLTSFKGHNPRRSSPCSEVARTGTHDFRFRCRYPATFPRRSRHRGNEALRARSFVLYRSKRRLWRFTRPWKMAACPATSLGRRITWRCSNAGWMKAWLPEIVSAGHTMKTAFCQLGFKFVIQPAPEQAFDYTIDCPQNSHGVELWPEELLQRHASLILKHAPFAS